MEQVAWVDDDDQVVEIVSRRRMRTERLRHRAVFIAVTDGAGRLLVHRRASNKDIWPGWCDIAVGGVVTAGETYDEAARRELDEEIGVRDVEIVALDEGFSRPYDDDMVSLLGRCYQVRTTGPFTFADGEVAEAWWVHRDGFDDLCRRERILPDSVALLLPLLVW